MTNTLNDTMNSLQELIDTLWNVNVSSFIFSKNAIVELIDTLWNVNSVITPSKSASPRINRYIMECKCLCGLTSATPRSRINRYIMECKFDIDDLTDEKLEELIDTLWNVNIDAFHFFFN